MLHKGQYNAKPLITRVVNLEDMIGAYEEVAYRTTVTAIMTA
jgi:threonine dehydrogenase-like Zn-dependent dehydrogenase